MQDIILISNFATLTSHSSTTESHLCEICGAPSVHSNYGVPTCDSCKIFFRRNATKEQKNFRCHFDGNCGINIDNRRTCAFCRLTKCLASGMQAGLIRCPRSNRKPVKKDKPQELFILNILQSDISTLGFSQWTLLLNIVYNYDERKLLSIAQQFINQSDNLDFTLPEQFFMNTYETSGQYIRSNSYFRTLSYDDRSAFLRNIADNITCLGSTFIWSWSELYNSQSFVNIHINHYGENSVTMIRQTLKFIDPDIIIAKLVLSLFAFSNHISIFSSHMTIKSFNTLAIFQIQNIYAEVTWNYLVYKYGYDQSIQRFNNLIQCLLAATMTVADAQNNENHVNEITSLVEQTELSLLLDDLD